jgi:peptidyl-tRNA hydrolase
MITIEELKAIAQQSMGEKYEEKKTYKLIHLAKSKDLLLSLNKNEFYINKSGQAINEDAIIDELYTPLFLQNCKNLC